MKRHTLAALVCLGLVGIEVPAFAGDPNDWDPPPRQVESTLPSQVHGEEGASTSLESDQLTGWDLWLESLWSLLGL